MTERKEVIHSRIWDEVPEPDNPFAAAACYCSGYDVYGDLLGKASWVEYLYLLFAGERPTPEQARLLEGLAIALANPGPRDHSVRAAMNAGVGGSTYASCLMASLAVGAGNLGGAREVALAVAYWQDCGTDLSRWRDRLAHPQQEQRADVWLPIEHPPGFDPNGTRCATPVRQTLAFLARTGTGQALTWVQTHRSDLDVAAACPLAFTGVAAAACTDLGLTVEQAEMIYLWLRLPGAAVHALEQQEYGWRRCPFFSDGLRLQDEPAPGKED